MNFRICFVCFMAITLFFGSFALASEDSPSPFPDDMYISDLPDLPEVVDTNNFANNNVASSDVAESITLSTPIDIPSDNLDNNSIEDASANKDDNSLSNVVESEEPSPIFITQDKNKKTNTIDTKKSLTDTLKSDKKQNIIEGTWLEKLAEVNPLSAINPPKEKDDLEVLMKKSRNKGKKGRSNASVFDISGIMLRMNLNQVEKTLTNRGFKKMNAKFAVPNFIKWRNEEACNSQGIIGFERIQACINTMAKKAGHEYVYYLKYTKFDSKEEIEVFLTSNFTENKVYKIVYKSKIAAVNGNSQKAIYMRNLKVYDFWKKINQKYGKPDNKNNVTWGLGGNKPFLKAATGYLLLEDPMFVEMDYTRMSREDKRYVHSDFYNF